MALRLVLSLEGHKIHPYQFDDGKCRYLSPPNLGKIDHLNFDRLPEVTMEYLRNEVTDEAYPP